MNKIALYLFLLFSPILCNAQTVEELRAEWEPVPSWPFTYQEFSDAKIYINTMQMVKAKANIHVGSHYVWYESKGQKLEAKKGIVTKVVFGNGDVYYPIQDKLCRVLLEDTIDGKVGRLYMSYELDRERFNELAKINNLSTMSLMDVSGAMSSIVNNVADREGANIFEQEPLPMKSKFYILHDGDTFEANESNILKHLHKDERTAYRAYTRRAEVLSTSRKSMENVWLTFFNK